MSAQELINIFGGIVAFVVMVGAAAWWLINKFFENQKVIEELKESAVKKALEVLEQTVHEFDITVKLLEKRLNIADQKFLETAKRIDMFEQAVGHKLEELGAMLRMVTDFVQKSPEKSEIRKIGNDLYILRAKTKKEGE